PGGTAAGAGSMPEVRYGTRARNDLIRSRKEYRTRGHDTTVLDCRDPQYSCPDSRNVGNDAWSSINSGNSCRSVVRLALIPTRMGLGNKSQPKHVHVDRYGNRDSVCL